MSIQLHPNARTTPAIRLELQAQPQSISNRELAETYNLSRHTVAKWRRREGMADASHRPHRLHATLGAAQEAVVVALRETFLLPLDDLLAVTREFIHPEVSRSGLDRCLRRHGVSNLKALMPQEEDVKSPVKTCKGYAPGFVRIDVKYLPWMPDQDQHSYLFAAIDRATRWVYVERLPDKSAASASGFLERLIEKAPFIIGKVLTDNGKEFTDRFCATGERQPTGSHVFDRVCADNRIEHRLIKPRAPRTNGMIERIDGRIADVLATTLFDSSEHLTDTLEGCAQVYNQHIPQKALGHIPPLQAMKNWYRKQPSLFKKRAYGPAGLDT